MVFKGSLNFEIYMLYLRFFFGLYIGLLCQPKHRAYLTCTCIWQNRQRFTEMKLLRLAGKFGNQK